MLFASFTAYANPLYPLWSFQLIEALDDVTADVDIDVGFGAQYMGMELGKYGIMVAAVVRGLSKTDPLLASRSEQQMQEAAKKMPLHRWTHPVRDLEALIAFLASDNGHYSTSNIFIADGGQSLPRPRMKSYL